MKKFLAGCFILAVFSGCSAGTERIKTFITDPPSLLQDPHYAQHQTAMNDLEKEYLHKQITYAEYLEKKKQLEEDYTREVQARERDMGDFRSERAR